MQERGPYAVGNAKKSGPFLHNRLERHLQLATASDECFLFPIGDTFPCSWSGLPPTRLHSRTIIAMPMQTSYDLFRYLELKNKVNELSVSLTKPAGPGLRQGRTTKHLIQLKE